MTRAGAVDKARAEMRARIEADPTGAKLEPKPFSAVREPGQGIQELAHIGTIARKKPRGMYAGKELRVAVKITDSETAEPAIDVREYLTPASDIRSSAYTGPTKVGLWLTVVDAEILCEMLAQALMVAEGYIEASEGGQ